MIGRVIAAFLDDLIAGDPVALGIAGFFLALGLIIAVILWFVKRHMAADDERWKKRRERRKRDHLGGSPRGRT